MKEAYAAEPSTLFVIGSYHIGKERAFFSAAQALGFSIWCDPGKKKVGSCSSPERARLRHAATCMMGAVCQLLLLASLSGPGTRPASCSVPWHKCPLSLHLKHLPALVPVRTDSGCGAADIKAQEQSCFSTEHSTQCPIGYCSCFSGVTCQRS